MSYSSKQLTPSDCPYEIDRVDVVKTYQSQKSASAVIAAIGYIVLAIGGLTLLLGPDSVRVSYSGPTFSQFILLYPGPITSVGFLIVFISSHIGADGPSKVENHIKEHYVLCDEDGNTATDAILAGEMRPDGGLILHRIPLTDTAPQTEDPSGAEAETTKPS
ncbi:hypothetical protein [Marinobacter mangrovi]|uniref:hypothetical protein n=1 Tax=Marinobacter mangrovi TaxID=2803918 RepID=UPI001934740A|nr:hypothetical protein [Marinobacter mangrovi]